MGHQNIQFTRQIDHEEDQDPDQQFPDPSIFYSSVPNFPQPNAVFYSMPPYNGVQPQYPMASLDVALSALSFNYNQYLGQPNGTRTFPVQVNHGAVDRFSLSTTQGIVGVPTDSYIQCMDGVRGPFQRKNFDGAPIYQHQNDSSGPSITARPAESYITQAGMNNPASVVEHGSQASMRNRANIVGMQSVQAPNNHVIQGNYIPPPFHFPGNPWFDSNYGANNGDIGNSAWPHSCNLPYGYGHASANGVGLQGYRIRAINSGPAPFMHPPYAQVHPSHHQLTQPLQVPSVNRPSLHRILPNNSSNTGVNPTLDAVDVGPTFLTPVPPTGFRLYRPRRREVILDPNIRPQNLPHLRILPEDEVAILDISGYHEVGDTSDQHRDLRLDIDEMSYEELLALGEEIGCVGTGLSEEFIRNHLKVRTLASFPAHINLETTDDQQRIDFCAVCQTDYEPEEQIGTLECGHEYHSGCIKKWLLMKNTCPVCKSPALRPDGNGNNPQSG